jgi:hypothetical protein
MDTDDHIIVHGTKPPVSSARGRHHGLSGCFAGEPPQAEARGRSGDWDDRLLNPPIKSGVFALFALFCGV